jgi:hypothetical protein
MCHDQEPLNYDFYQQCSQNNTAINKLDEFINNKLGPVVDNLRLALPINLHDKTILLHSEKNSSDLEKYENNGYIGAYYWAHALIARDWFRFAKHDHRLCRPEKNITDFLIYCRDWSGSREYRIKFQELLYKNNLTKNSITGIMKYQGNKDALKNFKFKNSEFIPADFEFFYNLSDNTVSSAASADYNPNDFNNSHVSVVLETMFDDARIHLTEKVLRPIACGHPFILAAGPGSLKYLRHYGFKTFDPWLNESYDLENNSVHRLEKIVQSMHEFSSLPTQNKQTVLREIKKIAKFNRQHFFSNKFINQVKSELVENIQVALVEVKKTRSLFFRARKKSADKSKTAIRNAAAKCLRKLKNLNPPLK